MGALNGMWSIEPTVLHSKAFFPLPLLTPSPERWLLSSHIHVHPPQTADAAETLPFPKSTTGSILHEVGPSQNSRALPHLKKKIHIL